ncbi:MULTISPECIES: O-methyltransferase [unclassified Nesterenkonia]|uniref:O-methyltransferase n=1 Tax=unclassified Nesterenkonia TaxID=2629769 RepID=UPI001F4C5472|nr:MULTISPECIES: O-methyltransferase [unclassified Nesterenkonia]MCH8560141.1 O-methyltransferase [Nesterenkonia sp. DZ6]MCH8564035.1 O-methyltransferase [Nesterenkonia sp. YGD6]
MVTAHDDFAAVDAYLIDHLVHEDQALADTRLSSAETATPGIDVTANMGAFLALLVQMTGATRVLEFGTLAGYSSIWMARAMDDDGAVVTLDIDPAAAQVARRNFHAAGVAERIQLRIGPALESAHALIDEGTHPFDLVFIDADKANTPHYLEASLTLSHPGTVIVIDNVVRSGAVLEQDSADPDIQGIRTLMELIQADERLSATALQTVGLKGWDGFLLARVN